jgi:hypothetical protein
MVLLFLLAQTRHYAPPFPMCLLDQNLHCTHANNPPFYPLLHEKRGSMYLQNTGSTVDIYTVQRPNSILNVKNKWP